MSVVERQDTHRVEPFSEHDQRRIGDPDLLIGVLLHNGAAFPQITDAELCHVVRPRAELIENSQLSVDAESGRHQVVELGNHVGRNDKWFIRYGSQSLDHGIVIGFV